MADPFRPAGRADDSHSRRSAFAYQALSAAAISIGFAWGITALWFDLKSLLISHVLVILVGLAGLQFTRMQQLRYGLVLLQLGYLCLTIYFGLFIDIPTAAAPRVSHYFLLLIALLGYIDYIRQKSALQLLIIAACALAFVVLASIQNPLGLVSPLPSEVLVIGAWFNATIATVLMAASVYVLQREFVLEKQMVRDLQTALRHGQLTLDYQPQVNAEGHVIGAEVLLRWNHPTEGAVSPVVFIPVAEEAGLMPELSHWVLRQSCRTLAEWRNHPHLAGLSLAVNVSATQFVQPLFEQELCDLLAQTKADPRQIKLELTESVAVASLDVVMAKMQALGRLGIRFSLDDFGTGYSSLNYLHNLPVHQIKIDRSFITEAQDDIRTGSLVRSIIGIGHDLGMVVLAEGVETRAQFEYLRSLGCQEFQGYYFGRPMSHADFVAMARQGDMTDERRASGA